ncbi:MAG: hypothetical protein U1A53_01175 [Prosthecobacter sp.]|nr:hypothetical protein [Prosthecobacter sp.]
MQDGTSALLFFYGLFWAEILATSARYQGFPTVTLWARWSYRDERTRRLKRIFASVVLLNVFPIVWLFVLYQCVVPKGAGFVPVSMAALASLSIFGITRLYHGVVASSETMNKYYTSEELTKWKIHGVDDPHPRWAHLVPSMFYLVCYPSAAIAVGWIASLCCNAHSGAPGLSQ